MTIEGLFHISLIYLYSLRSLGSANHRQQQCEPQGPAVNRHSIESMWPISRNVSNQQNQYNHPNQSNPRDIWAARQPPASWHPCQFTLPLSTRKTISTMRLTEKCCCIKSSNMSMSKSNQRDIKLPWQGPTSIEKK